MILYCRPVPKGFRSLRFQFLKKYIFWYMIVHIKLNIVTKFGEKINTRTMIKFGLNLSAFLVSIFREISIFQTQKNARSELVAWCMTTHVITCVHTRYTHFRVTYLSRSVSLNRVLLPQTFLCGFLLVACSLWFSSREKKRQTPVKRSKSGPLLDEYLIKKSDHFHVFAFFRKMVS